MSSWSRLGSQGRAGIVRDGKPSPTTICHLAHGQRLVSSRERSGMMPAGRMVELARGRRVLCGSAGIYNITQPEKSEKLLDRKVRHILETHAAVVATANPGCHLQIVRGLSAPPAHRVEVRAPGIASGPRLPERSGPAPATRRRTGRRACAFALTWRRAPPLARTPHIDKDPENEALINELSPSPPRSCFCARLLMASAQTAPAAGAAKGARTVTLTGSDQMKYDTSTISGQAWRNVAHRVE